MVGLFSRAKINININPPPGHFTSKSLARLCLDGSMGQIVLDFHLLDNLRSWWNSNIPQIKARPFEVLGCRAFLISGYADDMNAFYEDGREIIYYHGISDLIDKIQYWLPRQQERQRMAEAAYERTLREHTYEHRFHEILSRIGLAG
jgi:spore maturation protein CgeB